MEDKKAKPSGGNPRNPATHGDRSVSADEFIKAHRQADMDIEADPEFSAHSPNDDLDEAETARLGEKTGLI